MSMRLPRLVLFASVLALPAACFDPSDPAGGGTTGDELTTGPTGSGPSGSGPSGSGPSGGSDDDASMSGMTMPVSETAGDTGDPGCMVDGDCVDVDTCSLDACEDGTCVHTPNVDDPECSCSSPTDCMQLPTDTECRTRTCNANVCGLDFTDSGTPLNETQQTAEDCLLVVCDGRGEVESIADDSDVPVDGLECTSDVCMDGVPSNDPVESGTKCAAGECDDDGDCVGCSDPADCGGTSTFCEAVTCEGQVCGIDPTDAGTVLPAGDQEAGDCQRLECDGKGNAASVADDEDQPGDDGSDCTNDVCQDGAVAQEAVVTNTSCDDNGGSFCDGAGECVECTQTSQCGGGSGCMVPACVDNECTLVPDVGASCNDGLFCTETDTCNATGTCVGSGDPCPGADGDNDCSEGCNETADNCTGADPQNSPCDDLLFCTETDRCNASGTCVGSGDPCDGPDGDSDCSETCNESSNACTANDPNNSDCGACRHCSSGTCINECNAIAMCCPGDVCISMGQSCP